MNILTFDIEDWYLDRKYFGANPSTEAIYYNILYRILDLLDSQNTKATFFCLGGLCEEFPDVIKSIFNRGHEVGCHSYVHQWVNKMDPKEFRQDTRNAIDALEQLIGTKVISYRAPAFSIGESNKWAFEILRELGIQNDASIFPGMRDFGGFPNFIGGGSPCRINHNGVILNEFPITMTKLPFVGKEIAYSGGGYFRMLPINFVKSRMAKATYNMCYFHISDLLPFKTNMLTRENFERYFQEPGSLKNRYLRYLKANFRRKYAFAGLAEIVRDFKFTSVTEAASSTALPIIEI